MGRTTFLHPFVSSLSDVLTEVWVKPPDMGVVAPGPEPLRRDRRGEPKGPPLGGRFLEKS